MKNEKTIELYAQIIREIKVRLSCRGAAFGGDWRLCRDPWSARSAFCKSVRFVSYSLSRASWRTKTSKLRVPPKFTNESHAGIILRKLEELHADFFPRRIEVFKEGTHAILQPATETTT